jgi:hypothetical protein
VLLLFVAAPTSAFILAVYAARAGHRSGKIAVVVSGTVRSGTRNTSRPDHHPVSLAAADAHAAVFV